jgi:MSHA biogenesis protein MshP
MIRMPSSKQKGFGAIAAIIVLVLLAGLAAGIVSLSTTQSLTLAQDEAAAKANQSARAGVEWGVYQALSSGANWGGTINGPFNLTCEPGAVGAAAKVVTAPLSNLAVPVTVNCTSQQFNEGETCTSSTSCTASPVRVYTITAIASQGTVTSPGYVERRRQAIVYH